MKKGLIEILICPVCQNTPFKLFIERESASEILEGRLNCYLCNKTFEIQAGIPNLLERTSPLISEEISGNLEMYEKERKHFDDKWLLSLPSGFRPRGERLEINTEAALKRLNFTGKETILEIGAGTTWLSSRIVKNYGCNVIATDILREKFIGLESAKVYMQRWGIYYERVLCQMEKLPFADNVFDVVMAYATIHHSEDISKAFSEVSRVLKLKGKLVLLQEGVSGIFRNNRIIGYDYEKQNPYGWNEHTYWAATYLRLARQHGFKPDIFWPAFLLKLENLSEETLANMKFGKLARFLIPFYKSSRIKGIINTKACLRLALSFFGIPLNMIAVKERDK